jgi:hypothetical protein
MGGGALSGDPEDAASFKPEAQTKVTLAGDYSFFAVTGL